MTPRFAEFTEGSGASPDAAAVFHRAMLNGGVMKSPYHVEWRVCGDCEQPPVRELDYPACSEVRPDLTVAKYPRRFLTLHVRCRKCPKCLRHRATRYASQAIAEIALSERTWFHTLTLSLENHVACAYRAGVDLDDFPALARAEGKEVTKCLKRMRKHRGPFRYLLVTEKHKSGLPHFHMLLHEVGGTRFRAIDLEGAALRGIRPRYWALGFSDCKIVPKDNTRNGAWYVCKYLSKNALTRVRPSQSYGLGLLERVKNEPRGKEGLHSQGKKPLF